MADNMSIPLQKELAGLKGLIRRGIYGAGSFTAPLWMEALFNQGKSSSALSQNIGKIPGMTPNPQTDVGRNLGNMLLNTLQGTSNKINAGERRRASRRGSAFNDPLSLRDKYGGSGDMDRGATRVSFQSDRVAPAVLNGVPGIVDVNPQTGEMLPGTWRRGDIDAGPGKVSEMNDPSQADYVAPTAFPPAPTLPPQERAYQTELARTQQMAAANPYFQQMDLYAQGQRAMQTQEDMNQVRDLGLAINRSMYGDMTTPRTPNQLMAGLTPPGPAQPVIPMDEEGYIGQLDTAAAGVQNFMRKYAEGMKKRQGEE